MPARPATERWVWRSLDDEDVPPYTPREGKWGKLRRELEALYDDAVGWANDQTNVVNSVNSALAKATFVRDELHRRSAEKSSRVIQRLTWVITVLTAVNVAAVIVALLR